MRPLTRLLAPALLAAAASLFMLPAIASAATPPGWCLGPGPCTIAPPAGTAQAAAPDGWCLLPTDICRRY